MKQSITTYPYWFLFQDHQVIYLKIALVQDILPTCSKPGIHHCQATQVYLAKL